MCCLLHFILFLPRYVTSVYNNIVMLNLQHIKHSYYLPYATTNYGKLNIPFQGPSLWNTTVDNVILSFVVTINCTFFVRHSSYL